MPKFDFNPSFPVASVEFVDDYDAEMLWEIENAYDGLSLRLLGSESVVGQRVLNDQEKIKLNRVLNHPRNSHLPAKAAREEIKRLRGKLERANSSREHWRREFLRCSEIQYTVDRWLNARTEMSQDGRIWSDVLPEHLDELKAELRELEIQNG